MRSKWLRRYFATTILTTILLLSLLTVVAHADDGRVTILGVSPDGYPNVTVRFSAINGGGLPLDGLSGKDVRIFENGVEQGQLFVYSFGQVSTPLAIMLAIDTSGSMEGEPLAKAKLAAGTFVSEMRSKDKLGVVSFGRSVNLEIPFAQGKKNLDRNSVMRSINKLTAQGDTRLYDAIYLAVSEAGKFEGNRAAVVLTDGEDTKSESRLEQAIDLAIEKHVPVYTIGLGPDVKVPILQQAAEQTGGRYYNAPSPQDLVYVFRLLSKQLQNEYEMYYVSETGAPAGSTAEVKLVVANPRQPELEAQVSYIVPAIGQRENRVATYALRTVEGMPRLLTDAQLETLGRLAAFLSFVGVFLVFTGWATKQNRHMLETRLADFVKDPRVAVLGKRKSLAQLAAGPLVMPTGRLASRFLPQDELDRLRQNLVLAGRPFGWKLEEFVAVRVILGIAVGALLFSLSYMRGNMPMAFLMAVIGAALGFLLPQVWLGMRIKSRQSQILKSLPDVLDLLTISVEAGVGFDGAVQEVCQKWRNPLTEEFSIALQEIRMGRARRDALKDMGTRTGVPEVQTFVSAIIQAHELGVNIAHTLSVQAQQMRIRRRQRAEELAHKAAVKMLFPMIFLIFPALFVVILGPAIPSLQAFMTSVK